MNKIYRISDKALLIALCAFAALILGYKHVQTPTITHTQQTTVFNANANKDNVNSKEEVKLAIESLVNTVDERLSKLGERRSEHTKEIIKQLKNLHNKLERLESDGKL